MQATAQIAAAMLNIDAESSIPDDGPWIPKETQRKAATPGQTKKHP
jgi:hypothetical protein